MKTRRLRLVRPRWTLGTMLLVVGWSAVVVWLNVRPRTCEVDRTLVIVPSSKEPVRCYLFEYGFPWICVSATWLDTPDDSGAEWLINRSEMYALHEPRNEHHIDSWPLAANIAIGLIAVLVLTVASKYLVRAVVAGLRAFVGKPPPNKGKGPSKSK